MTSEIVSVLCGGDGPVFPPGPPVNVINNRSNEFTPCQMYQTMYETFDCEVLIYTHDDIEIYDPDWHSRVMSLFDNPACAVVGLGGATQLGSHDLYKKPYKLQDMARGGYASNQCDWQVHGEHETGDKQVAVVDAFFMAVRTDLLRKAGGWPADHLSHHCLDLWVCCEAARQGRQVFMSGVDCSHWGGGTSVKNLYRDAKWLQGGSLEEDHRQPHAWLHREYADVLPLRIEGGKA